MMMHDRPEEAGLARHYHRVTRTQKNKFAANRDLLDGMGEVASSFKDWRPAQEVLTSVEAVPTIFPQYDIATRVMGHPTARFCRLRGPSNEGKTTFMIGLMKSFLMKNHFAALADAERTTPPEWLEEMMGDYLGHPAFGALPVKTYEHTVDAVRQYCETIAEGRIKGRIPEETTALVCIDSIRKLVPKNLLANLLKDGATGKKASKGVDGFGGRGGQIKAALNAAWVDELVPLLADTRCSMLIVARETVDPDAGMWDEGIKVGGGTALYYDSSLDIRVGRTFITEPDDKKRILGERHRVEIRKTKVGKKELKIPFGYFHTSNGVVSPVGFDLARDVLELAKNEGVIELKGASYSYGGERLAVGAEKMLAVLYQNGDLLHEIEMASREAACASW